MTKYLMEYNPTTGGWDIFEVATGETVLHNRTKAEAERLTDRWNRE